MSEKVVYRFKKDDPQYNENRRNHLVEITKARYENDETFRNKCKERSRLYYQRLEQAAVNIYIYTCKA